MIKDKKIASEIAEAINKVKNNYDWFGLTATLQEDNNNYEVLTDGDFSETDYETLRQIADYFGLIYHLNLHVSVYNEKMYIW